MSTFFYIKGYANTLRIKASKLVRRPLENICGQLSRNSKYNSSTCDLCEKDGINSALMAYFQLNQQVRQTQCALIAASWIQTNKIETWGSSVSWPIFYKKNRSTIRKLVWNKFVNSPPQELFAECLFYEIKFLNA